LRDVFDRGNIISATFASRQDFRVEPESPSCARAAAPQARSCSRLSMPQITDDFVGYPVYPPAAAALHVIMPYSNPPSSGAIGVNRSDMPFQ
jgi:hypothetical protein